MKLPKIDKPTYVLIAIAIIAFLLRLVFVLWLRDGYRIVQFLTDDPFYYFQLSTNFITGNGPSLNGEHLTNGFHPLWMILISPLFLLKGVSPDLPVKLTLILSAILSLGVALFIYLATDKFTNNKWLAVFAFFIYLFTERSFLFDMYGEPSPLSNLLLAIGVYLLARAAVSGRLSLRGAIVFGVTGGLMILARTDNVLFFTLFCLLALIWLEGRSRIGRILVAGAVSFIVVLPWLLWSYFTFGTIVQTSADACSILFRANILQGVNDPLDIARLAINQVTDLGHTKMLFAYFPLFHGLLIVVGTLAAVFVNNGDKAKKRAALLTLAATGVVFLVYLLHTAYGFYLRPWHAASFAIFTTLIVTFALYSNIPKRALNKVLFAVAAFYLLVFVFYIPYRLTHPPNPEFVEPLKGAEYVNAHPEYKFAAYDSGILAYYTDGAVLSIDGNVNPDAYRAVKEKRLYEYMKQEGVDYLIGYGDWVHKLNAQFWPGDFDELFEEVPNDLDEPGLDFGCDYSVYRLKRTRPIK